MIPIAIIEDIAAIREALAEYLCLQAEFSCVLVVDSVEAFLAGLPGLPEPPRLVLSDIGLPGRSGIEGLPLIKAQLPAAQVVMLSVFADAERVFQALCAGAVGYLLKNTAPATIKESLLQVANGGSAMSPAIARLVIGHFQPRQTSEEPLTPREQQIVQAIEEGLSYKLIAARLGISIDTVRNHIQQVYRKLGVNSKGEVMARAYKRGGVAG
jgi:DNA-binding NarL/FixJ family response regulator